MPSELDVYEYAADVEFDSLSKEEYIKKVADEMFERQMAEISGGGAEEGYKFPMQETDWYGLQTSGDGGAVMSDEDWDRFISKMYEGQQAFKEKSLVRRILEWYSPLIFNPHAPETQERRKHLILFLQDYMRNTAGGFVDLTHIDSKIPSIIPGPSEEDFRRAKEIFQQMEERDRKEHDRLHRINNSE